MSLSPSQAEVVFAEAAESFVDDAASNPHPNVLFNAGLAWAQGWEPAQSEANAAVRHCSRGHPEACALQLVREQDGPDAIRAPMPWFAPLAQLGVAMATLLPAAALLAGALLSAAGVLWGLRRPDLAGLTLVAALVVALPLFSRTLPVPGAIAAGELIPFEGPGDGYAATNASEAR